MSKKHIGVYLNEELKARWVNHCKEKGLKAGVVLKEEIIRQLDSLPSQKIQINRSLQDKPDEGLKVRKEIRLTPSEWVAIENRAVAEGSSIQHWMNCAIRASLTHEPQFTREAIQALSKSSYELMAIGRNLNQIAKQMNQQPNSHSLNSQEIESLQKIIKDHMHEVSLLVSASASRWQIA